MDCNAYFFSSVACATPHIDCNHVACTMVISTERYNARAKFALEFNERQPVHLMLL